MKGVTTTAGHQGQSASGDYYEIKRDEDRGGYGMATGDFETPETYGKK